MLPWISITATGEFAAQRASNTFFSVWWRHHAFFTAASLILYDSPVIDICCYINSLRPRPNRRHFADDIFKRIFFNENVWIWIKISLKFVPKGPINNIPALVQIMAWRRPGDKPLSGPMMVSLLTHICVTRPQWVKAIPCYESGDVDGFYWLALIC